MIKGKVLLGLMAGFSVGTLLGALFASGKKEKAEKNKPGKEQDKEEEEVVIKY